MIETDIWPFIPAAKFAHHLGPRDVLWIMVHDAEAHERRGSARGVAAYFAAGSEGRDASAHIVTDDAEIIQCVHDRDIAWAAGHTANTHGIHIELVGFQSQTREQWLDEYGRRVFENAGNIVAQYALKFGIPLVHLSDAELAARKPGVVGHVQASRVFRESDHTDPGPSFPWDVLMDRAGFYYDQRRAVHGL